MKPRIRLRWGIWACITRQPFVCGCGYTPTEAYDEWRRIRQESPTT